ncbi:unnamed protein product [Menidia menidia]|uniref:(Atlantic silverside) hypothetical protein n=1 Tax=Menidia menidia TaxID=238744 RepID=A0A8S4AJE5_9TELE|nr:unnamed protein product [Menidia menidia]
MKLRCPTRLFVFLSCTAALLSSEIEPTQGMRVTSTGPYRIQRAEGESVTLGCTYSPSPFDTGELDIEWTVVSQDTTQKDYMFLSYSGGSQFRHSGHAFAEGLSFAAGDPSNGDASLWISRLSPVHSATYQCKVKKSPGVDTRKMSLVVMVKPSVPKCWVKGQELVGEAVSLHCLSAKGSPPLRYRWRSQSAQRLPDATMQNSGTGELKISNHSPSFAGMYLCEVNNAVGAERCEINLKANKPPNRAAVIVGTSVGSLLLIFILLVFAALLFWKLRSRRHSEKEFSNEIREDAQPPESRPASRRTGRSSGQHPQVAFRQVDGSEVISFNEDGSDGHTPEDKYASAEHDSKYGDEV